MSLFDTFCEGVCKLSIIFKGVFVLELIKIYEQIENCLKNFHSLKIQSLALIHLHFQLKYWNWKCICMKSGFYFHITQKSAIKFYSFVFINLHMCIYSSSFIDAWIFMNFSSVDVNEKWWKKVLFALYDNVDELIDVIEGNRIYLRCLYVINKSVFNHSTLTTDTLTSHFHTVILILSLSDSNGRKVVGHFVLDFCCINFFTS